MLNHVLKLLTIDNNCYYCLLLHISILKICLLNIMTSSSTKICKIVAYILYMIYYHNECE